MFPFSSHVQGLTVVVGVVVVGLVVVGVVVVGVVVVVVALYFHLDFNHLPS